MTPAERHARVKELFLAACEQPRAQRLSFLHDSATDAQIRGEVEELLLHYEEEEEPGPLTAGTLYAERYRIVSLIGRGGMGEVYRADDIRLGVPVALKRLHRGDAAIDEVRIARDITHHAVCRVFDIGESGGESFFTMEYVDGEDLASLLRRIGRLPSDKVADIGRQLCSALAAAHARGVLHRDLKPANILIDSRGRVRLTDFGIAVAAGRRALAAGTPAYMSPEQIAGAPLTEASDLYAAGIVLYELVTGRPAFEASSMGALFELQRNAAPLPPSEVVRDLDPQLERAILHAMQKDPEQRPRSALSWAGELPGGDALQIAADAGITPSPELVAASAGEGLPRRAAIACVVTSILAMLLCVELLQRGVRLESFGFDEPPAVLRTHAADVAARLSLPLKYAQSGFLQNPASTSPKQALLFWWRSESKEEQLPFVTKVLAPSELLDAQEPAQGPRRTPHLLLFDSAGHLVYARSPTIDLRNHKDVLLHGAGGPGTITEHEFATSRADLVAGAPPQAAERRIVLALFILGLLLVAIPLAIRNVRRGRTDRNRARRLAQIVGALWLLDALILGYRTSHPLHDPSLLLYQRLISALTVALCAWIAYAGLEPYVRQRWPRILVGSTRLLGGRLIDARIAREILLGVAGGTLLVLLSAIDRFVVTASGLAADPPPLLLRQFIVASDLRRLFALFVEAVPQAVVDGVVSLLVLVLLRTLLRRERPAIIAFVIAMASMIALGGSHYSLSWLIVGVPAAIVVLLLLRQGLLAYVTAAFVRALMFSVPLTTHGDAWYADSGYAVLVVIALMAMAAFAVSTRGQRAATLA